MFGLLIHILLLTTDIDSSLSSFSDLIEINISLTVIGHGLIFLLVPLSVVRLITLRSSFAMNGSHRLQTRSRIESLLTYFILISYFLI